MDKNRKPIYDARKELPRSKIFILAVQHVFAFFGATVLVPILTGLPVQTTLLFAGIGTIIFHVCTKAKVPAFLGSSFAFLGGFSAVKSAPAYSSLPEGEQLAYACGGIVIAGLMYIILAIIIKLVGVNRVMRYLPPVVTGPIIICIGLSLAPSAISNASENWLLAIIAIATVIIFNIWGKGMWGVVPILMGVIVSYIVALIMQIGFGIQTIDFSSISSAAIIGLPPITLAKFGTVAILQMTPISLATMMEHVGDISAISATTKRNFIEDPGLHRTLIGDGVATSVAALFGAPANTTYGENTGVLALTGVYDPFVIRLSACIAILLGFIPKVSAIISSMPTAIIGGISFILYGMISAIGVRNMSENNVSLSKSRNLIIVSVILVCGLGLPSNGLAISAVVGIILNAILPGKDYEFGHTTKDSSEGTLAIKANNLE
ncbi:uracil-xanthine permease [Candidatus Saccharibacteria bacterium]|nr:uracil-xanthine permease [Candidatus Saccharibacteria bacterium]